jgi:inner membrane protein COX18
MRASLFPRRLHLQLLSGARVGRYEAPSRNPSQTRHFHPTRPTRLIDESVLLAHGLLQGVHSATSLPWVVSIPLTAVIVRTVVAMPLQIWSVSHKRTQAKLSPLVLAWGRYHQHDVMSQAEQKGIVLGPARAQRKVDRAWKRSTRDLYQRWGVRSWAGYAPFLQLPAWLSMMESIRWMVDAPGGVLRWFQSWAGTIDKESATALIPVAESMYTEGALWFQNLLVADPTWILPITLSASVLMNIRLGWTVPSKEALDGMPRNQARRQRAFKGLRTALQIVACSLAPTMIHAEIPAGLLVYWISSTLFATAQTQILLKTMPIPTPIKPIKGKDVGIKKSALLSQPK